MNNDQVSSDDLAFGEINFFSPSSRINRLRYWAHSMLIAIPFYILAGISVYLATSISPLFWGIAVIAYIGLIVFSFIVMIQRLHDLNKSGWLSLLIFVPFANLYLAILLIFFAGTPGRNDYGLQTPPNKTWHWIMALVMPIVLTIGILAAVALPAYQQYKVRAEENTLESSSMDAMDDATEEVAPEDEGLMESEGEESIDGEDAGESADDSVVEEEKVEDATTSESTETPKAPQ
jgi:uncharacterized membrane protein YhaH (DUF805 family)